MTRRAGKLYLKYPYVYKCWLSTTNCLVTREYLSDAQGVSTHHYFRLILVSSTRDMKAPCARLQSLFLLPNLFIMLMKSAFLLRESWQWFMYTIKNTWVNLIAIARTARLIFVLALNHNQSKTGHHTAQHKNKSLVSHMTDSFHKKIIRNSCRLFHLTEGQTLNTCSLDGCQDWAHSII